MQPHKKSESKHFETFHSGDRRKIGGISYIPVHVDHSVCGAYSFIIETSEGLIGYTGDIRMHGPRSDMTLEMIDKMKEEKPKLLITEGTNISGSSIGSEAEVKEKSKHVVERSTGTIFVTFSTSDLDRLRTFYEIAKEKDIPMTITPKQAYTMREMHQYLKDLPEINDPYIEVFKKEKGRIEAYEREVFNSEVKAVKAEEIGALQRVVGFYDLNELINIKPKQGSVYILSQSEPFN